MSRTYHSTQGSAIERSPNVNASANARYIMSTEPTQYALNAAALNAYPNVRPELKEIRYIVRGDVVVQVAHVCL